MKAVPTLTIGVETKLQKDMEEITEQSKRNLTNIQFQLYEKEKAIAKLAERDLLNTDAIASLSDKIQEMMTKIQKLEDKRE